MLEGNHGGVLITLKLPGLLICRISKPIGALSLVPAPPRPPSIPNPNERQLVRKAGNQRELRTRFIQTDENARAALMLPSGPPPSRTPPRSLENRYSTARVSLVCSDER